jgi:hypothetical protein
MRNLHFCDGESNFMKKSFWKKESRIALGFYLKFSVDGSHTDESGSSKYFSAPAKSTSLNDLSLLFLISLFCCVFTVKYIIKPQLYPDNGNWPKVVLG